MYAMLLIFRAPKVDKTLRKSAVPYSSFHFYNEYLGGTQ